MLQAHRPADHRADPEPERDPSKRHDVRIEERPDHREEHAEGGQRHSRARPLGRAEALQAQHEHRRGDDVAVAQRLRSDVLAEERAHGQVRRLQQVEQPGEHRGDGEDEAERLQLDRAARAARTLLRGLEHPQHAVRDQEPADGVRRRARDRDEPEQGAHPAVRNGAVVGARHDERSDERDRGDGVRRRHERRVQERRDPGDDVVAEESGQHEDVEADFELAAHAVTVAPSAAFTASFTTSPACVTQAPRTTSSVRSIDTAPSFTSSRSSSVTFRA